MTTDRVEYEQFVTACCECGKIRQGDRWCDPDETTIGRARLTHGYCPECFETAVTAFTAFSKATGLVGKAS